MCIRDSYNTDRNGDVRCLCPKCLSDYIHDPNYIVRRLDPFAKSKDHCDKCNNSGWDYIVYDKRTSVKGKAVSYTHLDVYKRQELHIVYTKLPKMSRGFKKCYEAYFIVI